MLKLPIGYAQCMLCMGCDKLQISTMRQLLDLIYHLIELVLMLFKVQVPFSEKIQHQERSQLFGLRSLLR